MVSFSAQSPATEKLIPGYQLLVFNMPELPEVETIVRKLRHHLLGKTIKEADVHWSRTLAFPSPKKFKEPLNDIIPFAHELKVVIFNKTDFDWAEKYAAQVPPQCKLYLQPEWDKASIVTPLIIEYIKQHPQWELSLQIHKYINVP